MDRHVLWLRRRIINRIVQDSLMAIVIVAGITGAFLVARTGMTLVLALVCGVVLGQVFAIGRLAHGLYRNPLNRSYLDQFLNQKYTYVAEAPNAATPEAGEPKDADDPGTAADIDEMPVLPGFTPLALLRDPVADPSPTYDILGNEDGQIVASIGRTSRAVEFLSELEDGRILHSQKLLVPPHRWLVVNRVGSDDPQQVLASHRTVLGQLRSQGIMPVATSASSVADALAAEHDAYVELGPFLGPFLSIDAVGRNPVPLLVRPTAASVLALGLREGERRETPAAEVQVEAAAVEPVPAPEEPAEVIAADITLEDVEVPRLTASVSVPVAAISTEPSQVPNGFFADGSSRYLGVQPRAETLRPPNARDFSEPRYTDSLRLEPVVMKRSAFPASDATPAAMVALRSEVDETSPLQDLETLVPSHLPEHLTPTGASPSYTSPNHASPSYTSPNHASANYMSRGLPKP